ncbi:EAL domain-containing protein [Marinomonas sp. C2222]|uniref:EAL domain-containing protein n=1 Tax=Marinomonas sargassi TaxID=2984494 RepID=A0ABT2YPU3_9GAMM|nr:EAL domain-containing protein [Marinomonas sargassi]MCV2401866.1 EAL domain-containing protein [Marinomonas sargassi]
MKLHNLTITQRLIFSNLLSLMILSFAIIMVIRSSYLVESTFKTQSQGHVEILTKNSDISRQVSSLTSRVKLLEQTFLFSETTLSKEATKIDLELQQLNELSANPELADKVDDFVDNFHRFLGSSLSLNRILKKIQEIDDQLEEQIDELAFHINQGELEITILGGDLHDEHNHTLIPMLREAFLTTGKIVESVHSRITPETEKVLIIEAEKELAILALHLESVDISVDIDSPELASHIRKMQITLRKYHAALSRIKANLAQRWGVMSSLVDSQNQLIALVEKTEKEVQIEAFELAKKLEAEISESRLNAILTSVFAFLISILLVSLVVKKHIRKPLNDLSAGFARIESDGTSRPINLHRTDEWNHIENTFNQMAERLSATYAELNAEKKNFDFLAHHDPLTGLANRLLGTQKLNEAIVKAKEKDSSFFLIYLDVDEFKTINDSLGHTAGDNLLIDVAHILEELVEGVGFVARMGGDEFMLVAEDRRANSEEMFLLEQINQSLRKSYLIDNKNVFVSASIGVCQFPYHGSDDETLIRNADTAMYHAKRNGKDQYRIYDDRMTLEVTDIIETNAGLRQAIANNELVVYFQPNLNLTSKKVMGAEALVRWQHPTLGLLQPAEFLEIAEKSDLIIDIDKWVFGEVARLISEWQKNGEDVADIAVSVNFSSRMFYMPDLSDQLKTILEESGCQPHQLILEITERDMMRDYDTCIETIVELRKQGYRIAIDDFGTGYSSLSVVKNLSADFLKLDRSFIQDLDTSTLDYEITRAVLTLAQILDLRVIAEGVENQRQLDHLCELGCNKAQGFFFSKPLPVEGWLEFLSEHR